MGAINRCRHYLGVLFRTGERWRLVVAVVASFVIAMMDAASVVSVAPLVQVMSAKAIVPGYAATVADILGINDVSSLVAVLLGAVAGGFILKDLFSIWFNWWMSGFIAHARLGAQMDAISYYLYRPYYDHTNIGLSGVLRRTGTSVVQAYGWATALLSAVSQSFSVATIIIALLLTAPQVTLGLLLFLVICIAVFQRVVAPINARLGREYVESAQEGFTASFDAFGAIKETQLRNAYDFFLEAVSSPYRKATEVGRMTQFLSGLPKQLLEILFMTGLVIVFGSLALLGRTNDVLASLALLVAGAFRLLPTASGMLGSVITMKQAEAGLRECIEDRLSFSSQGNRRAAASSADTDRLPMRRELRLEGIRYRYGADTPEVLKGIDLVIPQGAAVAFVGSSGAGKTTLLDIIMGLLTPTGGSLLADGLDVSAALPAWQRNVAVVPQEIFMTDRTLAENIAFDVPVQDIDREKVWRTLAQADLLEFVKGLPNGLDTVFGERGKRLSGGQRQRVGIARALYRDPSILILDEATSALDNVTEERIAQTVRALRGSITVITVAHRLSTVRDADMIAFLVDGKVSDAGQFQELVSRNAGFRRLVELGMLTAEYTS